MSDDNKLNLFYFESPSMRGLFDSLQVWQDENRKRFLSISVQKDGDRFCCIALSNPAEVVITDESGKEHVWVHRGSLSVYS